MGKVGAFVGTYVLPLAQENAPNPIRAGQDPFFISSSLCILSAVLTWLFMPYIGQVSLLLARRLSAFDPGLISHYLWIGYNHGGRCPFPPISRGQRI